MRLRRVQRVLVYFFLVFGNSRWVPAHFEARIKLLETKMNHFEAQMLHFGLKMNRRKAEIMRFGSNMNRLKAEMKHVQFVDIAQSLTLTNELGEPTMLERMWKPILGLTTNKGNGHACG